MGVEKEAVGMMAGTTMGAETAAAGASGAGILGLLFIVMLMEMGTWYSSR